MAGEGIGEADFVVAPGSASSSTPPTPAASKSLGTTAVEEGRVAGVAVYPFSASFRKQTPATPVMEEEGKREEMEGRTAGGGVEEGGT